MIIFNIRGYAQAPMRPFTFCDDRLISIHPATSFLPIFFQIQLPCYLIASISIHSKILIVMIRFLLLLFTSPFLHAEELSLFPSRSLDDWTSKGSAKWNYQNGVLSGGQDGDPKRSGLLISKAKFQDFDLSLEFKIDEHGKYNSGIYLRYHAEQKGDRLQVNIGRGAADEPVGLYLNDWLDKGDAKDEVRKPKAWNSLRIKALGPHIQVWLNGKKIVDYQDAKRLAKHLAPGHFAIQTYGAESHAGWVKFRKMKIKPLPRAN